MKCASLICRPFFEPLCTTAWGLVKQQLHIECVEFQCLDPPQPQDKGSHTMCLTLQTRVQDFVRSAGGHFCTSCAAAAAFPQGPSKCGGESPAHHHYLLLNEGDLKHSIIRVPCMRR